MTDLDRYKQLTEKSVRVGISDSEHEIVERLKAEIKLIKMNKNYEDSHDEKNICLRCAYLTLKSILENK